MTGSANVVQREFFSPSAEATRKVASELAFRAELPGLIALVGQLGAGKTEFVKGLGEGLGIDPASICSATFVIVCEYGEGPRLTHADAYRLGDPAELESIGWEEMLVQEDTLVAVEWADRIADELPADTLWVTLESISPTERRIKLRAHAQSTWARAIEELSDPD